MCGRCGELVAAAVVPALENIAITLGLRQAIDAPAGVGACPRVAAFAVNADNSPNRVYDEVIAERVRNFYSFKLSDTASICLKVNTIWSRFRRGGDGKAVRRAVILVARTAAIVHDADIVLSGHYFGGQREIICIEPGHARLGVRYRDRAYGACKDVPGRA